MISQIEFDNLGKESTFYDHMSKEELIGYCDTHCETQRALFNKEQIAQMIQYAGRPKEWPRPEEIIAERQEWYSLHDEMKTLVGLAKKVLKEE